MSNIIERYNNQKNKEIPNRLKTNNEAIDKLIASHNLVTEKQEQEEIEKELAGEILKAIEKSINI